MVLERYSTVINKVSPSTPMVTCCPTKLIQVHNETQLLWNNAGWHLILCSALATSSCTDPSSDIKFYTVRLKWQTLHSLGSGARFAQPLQGLRGLMCLTFLYDFSFPTFPSPKGALPNHSSQSQWQHVAPGCFKTPGLWLLWQHQAVSLTLLFRDVTEMLNSSSVIHTHLPTFWCSVSAPEKAA